MDKYTILLQEDDCAPDAYTTFLEAFKKMFNMDFKDWCKEASRISMYDDEIRYERGDIHAYNSACDPYWVISKIEKND